MMYMRCIENKPYLHHEGETTVNELVDLTLGAIYRVLPITAQEQEDGLLRVVDNSGEDYLYPAHYFEPVDLSNGTRVSQPVVGTVTVHLDPVLKAVLQAEALASHVSMSALVRQWISERLTGQEPEQSSLS